MNIFTQILIALLAFSRCAWANVKLKQSVLNKIFTDYDKRVVPDGENGTGALIVEVSFFVGSLSNLDDVNMVFSTDLTFRQKWVDERLRYNDTDLDCLTLSDTDNLWIPNLFFKNEVKGYSHNTQKPINLVRIYPDGHVILSTRLSLKLHCYMELKNYPMDEQICEIKPSYAHTRNDVMFQWRKEVPVQIKNNIYIPNFTLKMFETDYCISLNTADYSCIISRLYFSRDITMYLVRVFIPTTLLIILSWFTFWLHPRLVTIRLGIVIGLLLSMIIMNVSFSEESPRVSYIKAMDVWIGTCICFIFSAIIETGLVGNATMTDDRRNKLDTAEKPEEMGSSISDKSNCNYTSKFSSFPLRWLKRCTTQAQIIDAISRFLFPLVFMFFNIFFWVIYKT